MGAEVSHQLPYCWALLMRTFAVSNSNFMRSVIVLFSLCL